MLAMTWTLSVFTFWNKRGNKDLSKDKIGDQRLWLYYLSSRKKNFQRFSPNIYFNEQQKYKKYNLCFLVPIPSSTWFFFLLGDTLSSVQALLLTMYLGGHSWQCSMDHRKCWESSSGWQVQGKQFTRCTITLAPPLHNFGPQFRPKVQRLNLGIVSSIWNYLSLISRWASLSQWINRNIKQ